MRACSGNSDRCRTIWCPSSDIPPIAEDSVANVRTKGTLVDQILASADFNFASAQFAEKGAHFPGESVRLFEGSKMPALFHDAPTPDVLEDALGGAARGL